MLIGSSKPLLAFTVWHCRIALTGMNLWRQLCFILGHATDDDDDEMMDGTVQRWQTRRLGVEENTESFGLS